MTKKSALKAWIGVVAVMFALPYAKAEVLSKEAQYQRCYAQLTGTVVPDNDPNLATFRSGSGNPIATCLAILDSARLTAAGNTTIADVTDARAKKVLENIQAMHTSFFYSSVTRTPFRDSEGPAQRDMFDGSAPALFLTRALFAPSIDASSILTDTANYRAIRTINDPATGLASGVAKSAYYFNGQANFKFAPTGELLGIGATGPLTLNFTTTRGSGSINVGENVGGGVLGSPGYLLNNVDEDIDLSSTLLKLPRRWSKAIFHDFLCRDFPAIRVSDAEAFVVATAGNPFRRSSSCIQCHATMDRTASVMRGFRYRPIDPIPNTDPRSVLWYTITTPTMAAEAGWPAGADANFYKRPPSGTLYFRSASTGTLVNMPVSNVAALGATIANQDDFYICLANRYWEYFTHKGVQIDEPTVMATRPASEQNRFAVVKTLGLSLKSHQSLRQLIQDILMRPEYIDSAFGPN